MFLGRMVAYPQDKNKLNEIIAESDPEGPDNVVSAKFKKATVDLIKTVLPGMFRRMANSRNTIKRQRRVTSPASTKTSVHCQVKTRISTHGMRTMRWLRQAIRRDKG